jgi:ATP-binding cassette subfamily B protein
LLRRIIDILTQYDTDRTASWPVLKWILLYGFCLWIFVEFGFRCRDFLRAKAFPKLEADMRMAMFDHIQHHSPHYFNEHFAGSLANKISDMTTQVSQILLNFMLFLPAVFTCILSVILFAWINGLFALILGIWVVIHFAICFAFTPKCAHYSNVHGEARSSLAGKIVDSLTNNFAVNLFFRFPFEHSHIAVHQREEKEKNELSQRYVAWMFVCLSIIFVIGGVLLNGFMILYWMQRKISTGEIIQVFNTTFNVILVMWFLWRNDSSIFLNRLALRHKP